MRIFSYNPFSTFSAGRLFPFLVVLLAFQAAAGQSRNVIHVGPAATIEGDRVRLGAISTITAEAGKAQRLEDVSLGYAPGVGMTREISREQILLAIAAAGFSANDITLIAPPRVLIHRGSQLISESRLRAAVEASMLAQFAADGVTAKIVALVLPESLSVPIGKLDIRVRPLGIRDVFSRFSLPIEIIVDGKTVRRLTATMSIEATAAVLVAAKDLPANARLGETDVRSEQRKLERPAASYLRDPAKLRGVITTKPLSGGTALTTDTVISGIVVRAGDAVQVEAKSGNLKFIIRGEARSAGKIGDRIAVKNSQSGAVLQAVVVDEGLVKVTL